MTTRSKKKHQLTHRRVIPFVLVRHDQFVVLFSSIKCNSRETNVVPTVQARQRLDGRASSSNCLYIFPSSASISHGALAKDKSLRGLFSLCLSLFLFTNTTITREEDEVWHVFSSVGRKSVLTLAFFFVGDLMLEE